VLLFAVLAVEIKRKAPTTHTCLEIIKVRWGTAAHLTFLVFCLLTNIIVTSMLILGERPRCALRCVRACTCVLLSFQG
jgi:Na+/proline symporter